MLSQGPRESNPDSAAHLITKNRQNFFLEAAIIVAAALAVFSYQVFMSGPMLSLLFDSQGYLWTSQACKQALEGQNLRLLAEYFASACGNETVRAAFISQNPGILELVKSGPVLPSLLVSSYAFAGKSLSLQNWQTGAWTMIAVSVSTVLGIWLFALQLGGKASGRIAAALAISYGGFAVNSGRILTEIPSAAISIFALFSAFLFVKAAEKKRHLLVQSLNNDELSLEERRNIKRSWDKPGRQECLSALLTGFFSALLMLARPTFLPWPLLLAFALFIYSFVSKNRNVFAATNLIAFLLGLTLPLIPWAMCKQVLSGSPSIVIERYGPYNLSVGMNLLNDGYDTLPSPLVGHPEQFKESAPDVAKEVFKQFQERPAATVHLLVRKPARIIDSPWNDFQIRFMGIPLLAQRFQHQLILLAAVFGICLLLENGRKKADYQLLYAGLIFGIFMAFHLVSSVFISMSRYFITAMPAAIVAASYFITQLFSRQRKGRLQALLSLLIPPTVSMLLYYLLVPGYGRLSDFSSDLGLAQTALLASTIMALSLSGGVLLPAFTFFKGARSKLLLSTFALISAFVAFVTVSYLFMCSEAVLRLGSVDKNKMLASTTIAPGNDFTRWYLLLDANDAGTHGEHRTKNGLLKDMSVELNGRELQTDWLPLMAVDKSLREEFMYLTAFAYSSGRNCTDFRQWFCTALPAESIVNPGENKAVFSLKEKSTSKPKLFADFQDNMGKRIHTVSLRKFSWSKGFFADCPGEMRMDEWTGDSNFDFDFFRLSGQSSRLKARVYLMGVKDTYAQELWQRSFNLPDQEIDGRGQKKMAGCELSLTALASELNSNPMQAMKICVSGQIRSNRADGQGSVCLLEEFKSKRNGTKVEFAPMAAQNLHCSQTWQEFAFEDVVSPIRNSKSGEQDERLETLKLQFFARPWWEALDYAIFKGPDKLEFRKLKVELAGQKSLDLQSEESRCFELDSQFQNN